MIGLGIIAALLITGVVTAKGLGCIAMVLLVCAIRAANGRD